LLEELNTLVESDGSLVLTVDADKEVGEVEGSDVGSLEETLEDLSGNLSVVLGVDISPGALLSNNSWGGLNWFLRHHHYLSHESSKFLIISISSLSFFNNFGFIFLEVLSNLWKVLE